MPTTTPWLRATTGDEQGVGLVVGDPCQVVGTGSGCRAGKLRQEAPGGLHQLVGDLVDRFDVDTHGRTVSETRSLSGVVRCGRKLVVGFAVDDPVERAAVELD
jgi:hypothetical protein